MIARWDDPFYSGEGIRSLLVAFGCPNQSWQILEL